MKKIVLLLSFLVAGLNAKSNLEQRVDLLERGFEILASKVVVLEQDLGSKTTKKEKTRNRKASKEVLNEENKKPR